MIGNLKLSHRVENLIGRYFAFLEKQGKTFNFIFALIWTSLLAAIDWYDPNNLSFGFFYLLPIAMTSWFSGKAYGCIISSICAVCWTIDNLSAKPLTLIWNIASCFCISFIFVILIHKVKLMLQNEYRLSRTDPLTGVMNSGAFAELVGYEILRQHRSITPFSLAFIDLDNFKLVNDHHGHQKGDQVLKAVATCMVQYLRKTDVVARYGGDEFVVFLPVTDLKAAQVAIVKVRDCLLKTVAMYDSVVTFSIGVVTCTHPPNDLDEVVTLADELMYKVKNSGKNNVKYKEINKPFRQKQHGSTEK